MSLPEQLDCNPQIAVQGLVGYEFGRQCVELGRLTSRIMAHAFIDISAPEDPALHAPKFYGFTDGLDLEHPSIQPVLAKYSRRYRDLGLAYIEYPGDNELSQAVFQVKPAKQVAASRFAGGVIFSLAKEDYINSCRNMSSNPDKAEKKARRSAGMAFAELVTIDEKSTEIPVGMVKRIELFTNGHNPYPGYPTPPLKADLVHNLDLQFTDVKRERRFKVSPKIYEDAPSKNLILVEEIIPHANITLIEDSIPIKGERQDFDIGPYRLTIEDGLIVVSIISESKHFPKKVLATTFISINAAIAFTSSSQIHELHHLLYSLYTPKRREANIRKRKPEIKQPRYQTEKKLVAGIANTILKGVIDQRISDEFLAQIAGGSSINDAVDVLAEEVEECGVCYDYVTENRDAILKAATTNINDFPDVDSIAAAAENKIRETYHQYLDRVAKKVIQYGLQSPHFAPLNEKQLISLLAPHPFHLWPVVLRSVNTYARGLEDRSTLSTLLRN